MTLRQHAAPLRFDYLLRVASGLLDDAYFPLVRESGLELLAELGIEAFGERGPRRYGMSRLEFYRRIFARSQHSFRLVLDPTKRRPLRLDDDALIGFTCVLPVSHAATERYLHGEISQFELTARDVQPAAERLDLWNQAIYLRRRSADWFAVLIHALARSMADQSGGRDLAARLIAEGTTPDGRQFLTSFGMDEVGDSKDGCPIFIADDRAGRSVGQIANRDVLTKLMRAYAGRGTE
jgi:hypothetical protein